MLPKRTFKKPNTIFKRKMIRMIRTMIRKIIILNLKKCRADWPSMTIAFMIMKLCHDWPASAVKLKL